MEKLEISMTEISPEIVLSPDDNTFIIKGVSRPEDVRELYYPVVEWLSAYEKYLQANGHDYSELNPMIWQFDLKYFNSSSAKFFHDICYMLKSIRHNGTPVSVTWIYDEEDTDMLEAGEDLAYLAEIEFIYMKRQDED